MPKRWLWPLFCWMLVVGFDTIAIAQPSLKLEAQSATSTRPTADEPPVLAPPARVAWDTSRVIGTPEPPPPFRGQRAFAKLKFQRPLFLIQEPEEPRRMLVVEQRGKVLAFKHSADSEQTEPFCGIEDHDTYSICFHPKFAENRWVYVFANGPQSDPKGRKNKILRFEVSAGESPQCLPESQTTIIQWPSNGHNGGEMDFGPEGYLYISSGDGTSDSDTDLTGQDISTLTSGVLRIDVDGAPQGKTYRVPEDNPFLHIPEARPELWAYGFRNPWRLRFDRKTGDLWVGDIGQDLWEMVHVVQRGANYGWSVMEGSHPFYLERRRGPTTITPPTIEHPHSEARSITGGIVYDGPLYPQLQGVYLYGDYATGKVWGARYRQGKVVWQEELADTSYQILAFCQGPAGEIYLVDYAGELYELTPSPAEDNSRDFPRRLSETGLFTDAARHQTHPGLIPYEVNSPLWSDGAIKQRFMAIPGEATVDYRPRGAWTFPENSVLVKTFSLPVAKDPRGSPQLKRIETRLLVLQQGEWQGYSYRWNDQQTDAELVSAVGADVSLLVAQGTNSQPEQPSSFRAQTWHFPSRAECMVCHSRAGTFVLGVNTWQLDRTVDFHGEAVNQIELFHQANVLGKYKRPAKPDAVRLVDPADASAPLELRARSYLHANCSQCHVESGGGNSAFAINIAKPEQTMKLISAAPLHHRFDLENPLLVAPGVPERSILLHRISTLDRGRMPPLSSSVVDPLGTELIRAWILDLEPVAAPDP